MIVSNTNINECSFLNNFNVDQLSCFVRPRCILSENILENSMYYYLFFTELRSSYHNKDYFHFITDLTGINFIKNIEHRDNFSQIIKKLLNENNYIILTIDLYYDENQPRFKQSELHHPHYTIVKGYNEEKKEYIVIDEEFRISVSVSNDNSGLIYSEQFISEEKLERLACNIGELEEYKYQNEFFVYYSAQCINKDYSGNCNFNKILTFYKEHIKYMDYILKDYFRKLNCSIVEFKGNLKAYKGKTSFFPYPIELKMLMEHYNAISTQHKLLNLLMHNSMQKETLDKLFSEVIISFQKIKGLLIKSFFSGKIEYCESVIGKDLEYAEKCEIELLEYLNEILDEMKYKQTKEGISIYFEQTDNDACSENKVLEKCLNYRLIESGNNIEISYKDIFFVELEMYLNNKGIFETLESEANIAGGGESFYFEKIMQSLEVNRFKFKLSYLSSHMDNVSCMGQKIILPRDCYKNIMFAGCAEWGSYKDNLIVHYTDGSSEEILISFTDWVSEPTYDETILLEGRMMENSNGVRKINLIFTTRLFGQEYKISDNKLLDHIILPYCPNIHIFAISLGK